ncbi:hypothetical protein N9937_01875 [bacterium]|nr:hypothetical protein [bacterium]
MTKSGIFAAGVIAVFIALIIWGNQVSNIAETKQQVAINNAFKALHFKRHRVQIYLYSTNWTEADFLASPGIQKAYVNFENGRCIYKKTTQND